MRAAVLLLLLAPSATALLPGAARLATRAAATRAVVKASEPERGIGTLALQTLPLAACFGAGDSWFAAVYVPLLALGRAAGASPSATLVLATLLYASAAALSHPDGQALLLTCAVNFGVAVALISLEFTWEDVGEEAGAERDLAEFDRRLRDASRQKR